MKKKLLTLALTLFALMSTSIQVCAQNYQSELTGLPIDSSLQIQRPVAVMVDNEKKALNNYGISYADIQYEMVNSTANGRITRSMYIIKDYNNIPQLGNIRSTRPTNLMIAPEYDAILLHDGGPYYCNYYYPSVSHISGGFTRVQNGKATEFTEFIKSGEALKRISQAKLSVTYAPGKNVNHFNFGANQMTNGTVANGIKLPFAHTSSELKYNAATNSYDHYLYGAAHIDAGNNQIVTYKNAFILDVSISQLDANGYLVYNILGNGKGYYASNGKIIHITWQKNSYEDRMRFFSADGTELIVNAGKTYIGLVPSDSFNQVTIL